MNSFKPLIVNTETYLGCAGNCSGCFLTDEERQSSNFYLHTIKDSLYEIVKENNENYNHIIVGFGRGNILNLDINHIDSIIEVCNCLNNEIDKPITFEISTSLIGKIDKQINIARYILEKVPNAYFNVVINSEITSNNFWENWWKFYNSNLKIREGFGYKDNTGDILVLNINPNNLPNLGFIKKNIELIHSPINISLFPSSNDISNNTLNDMQKWVFNMFLEFRDSDLNIKNYLKQLSEFSVEDLSLNDFVEFCNNNERVYFFIDKNNNVTKGSLSIMGEVDFPRLKEKYNLSLDKLSTFKELKKIKYCSSCEYQRTCVASGAAYNAIINSSKITEQIEYCPSGYKVIFQQFS